VHVSGHASAGELVYCYNLVRPKNVMPVHGEPRHLKANAELAIRTGVDPENVLITQDGTVVDLVNGRARVAGRIPADYVYVENMVAGAATEESLQDRVRLAEDGALSVLAIVDPKTGFLEEAPEFFPVGFNFSVQERSKAANIVQKAFAGLNGPKAGTSAERIVVEALTRWSDRALRRKPVITVIIVDAI